MDDFKEVNDVYSLYFVDNLPARSCVAVKTLPKNAKVEIECMKLDPHLPALHLCPLSSSCLPPAVDLSADFSESFPSSLPIIFGISTRYELT